MKSCQLRSVRILKLQENYYNSGEQTMAILKILEYPDPFLLLKANPVEHIDEETLKLIQNMAETMFDAPGVGLAAPQVGSDKRIIVYNPGAKSERGRVGGQGEDKESFVDTEETQQGKENLDEECNDVSSGNEAYACSDKRKKSAQQEYRAIINPEIVAASGSLISENEACLSVPDFSADVRRFSKVTVRGLNVDGKRIQFDAEDIQAVIMQHEIDHLDGILYIERISMLKRNMYKKRVKKRAKQG